MAEEGQDRRKIAHAVANLIGALQDLMKLSGTSLSKTIHAAAARHGIAATASLHAGGALVKLTPQALWDFMGKVLVRKVLQTNINANSTRHWQQSVKGMKEVVNAILNGKDVDMRPVAHAFIMSLDAGDVTKVAKRVVHALLDTYVFKAYKPSGGSIVCTLCKSAPKCYEKTPNVKRTLNSNTNSSAALAKILKKVIDNLQLLLVLEHLTVTKALRQALDSNLWFLGWGVGYVASFAVDSRFVHTMARRFYPKVSDILHQYGLGIQPEDLEKLIAKHAHTIAKFLRKERGATIGPVLIDLVVASKPLHLIHGIRGAVVGTRTNAASGHAFCAMCHAWCG